MFHTSRLLRLTIVLIVAALVLTTLALPSSTRVNAQGSSPLKGQKIDMAILGIGGWLPSSLGAKMANDLFKPYAKDKYGYDVAFTTAEAPFSDLFQKAAASLATKSQEYNIIISDSQWLGALAEPKWIVNISDLIKKYPEFDIQWYNKVVSDTYQIYPDASDQKWGLPEEGDVVVLFVRTDIVNNPDEMKAFKAKYGFDIPKTFEEWEKIDFDAFEKIAEFFTRPDKNLFGTVLQYSKVYDFMTMYLYPFMFSAGGDIWDPKERRIVGILDSEVNAKAMEVNRRYLKYQPPGALQYGIAENVDAFTQGKVATAFQWAAVGLSMVTKELKDKVMVVPPPGIKQADGSIKRVYSVGGQPWVINAFNDAAHMEVAIDFLKWWYLPETQLEYSKRGGNPTDKATLSRPDFESINPWNRAYKYMLTTEHARDFWHEPNYSEMLAAQQEGFTAYASGQVNDAMNTLKWIACQQQKILFDNNRSKIQPPDECANIQLNK